MNHNQRDYNYYEEHAADVRLGEITSCERNIRILRWLRGGNDEEFNKFPRIHLDLGITVSDFFSNLALNKCNDLGWLGYFIGRSRQLKDLSIFFDTTLQGDPGLSLPQVDALVQGISLNRSITRLGIHGELGDILLQRLDQFLRGNMKLAHLHVLGFDIGLASALKLALVLRDMSLKSFQVERLCYDFDAEVFIDDGAVAAEVITSLSKHTKLKSLELVQCNLDRRGCMALGKLPSLKELRLQSNGIDDEGMKALACGLSVSVRSLPSSRSGLAVLHSLKELSLTKSIAGDDALHCLVAALANNTAVELLDLSRNTSITAKGLSSLSSLLQSERCCLKDLRLRYMRIGDDGAAALADALAGNKSVKRLEFEDWVLALEPIEVEIGSIGWSAFARLLCDTSSVNNTYLSNHTLKKCKCNDNPLFNRTSVIVPPDVEYYLALNRDLEQASMYKILSEHPEFDMKPLLQQWQLKFLPLMVAWFEAARARQHLMRRDVFTSIDVLQRRELSAIYQFMRGLPSLAVEGCLDQQMAGSQSKKRKQTMIDSFVNEVDRPLRRRNVAREMNEEAE